MSPRRYRNEINKTIRFEKICRNVGGKLRCFSSVIINVSAIYRSACTAPRIFETQDEGQRQCMGLQYRKREHGKQCELRRLRR
jgi:hypothetical protein